MASAFLDTSVIIHAATTQNEGKARIAQDILAAADFCLSVQVLHEFYISVRKPGIDMPDDIANQWIANLLEFDCAVIDTDIFFTAKRLAARHRIHYFDAALIASARRLGARTIFTENLNHGQDFGSVTAINPFLET